MKRDVIIRNILLYKMNHNFIEYYSKNADDCGTGRGGFKTGNVCATGGKGKGGGSPATKDKKKPKSESVDDGGGSGQYAGLSEMPEDDESISRLASTVARRAYTDGIEQRVASTFGGVWLKDSEPIDARIPKPSGRGFHDVEVKSKLDASGSKKGSLSVGPGALLDKALHAAKNPLNTYHTVVFDKRNEYNNGEHADSYSGHEIYYKRASGPYSLSKMHKVKDMDELWKLMNTPNGKLSEAARGEFPSGEALEAMRAKAAKDRAYNNARSKKRKADLGKAAYGK